MRIMTYVTTEASALMLASSNESSYLLLSLLAESVKQLQRSNAPVCPWKFEVLVCVMTYSVAVQRLIEAC